MKKIFLVRLEKKENAISKTRHIFFSSGLNMISLYKKNSGLTKIFKFHELKGVSKIKKHTGENIIKIS